MGRREKSLLTGNMLLIARLTDLFCGCFNDGLAAENFALPFSRRRANDGRKSFGESGLVCKSSEPCNFGQGILRLCEERLSDFDAMQNQVLMCGGSKRFPERSRKMADGESA